MRKIVLIALFTLLIPNTWQNINSEIPKPMDIELISSGGTYNRIKKSKFRSQKRSLLNKLKVLASKRQQSKKYIFLDFKYFFTNNL